MDYQNSFTALYWNNGDDIAYARVDGYPNPMKRYTTLEWRTANFAGSFEIQGSIKSNPTENDWFHLETVTKVAPQPLEEKLATGLSNYRGRIVTMRIIPNIVSGIIDYVIVK